MKYLKPLITIGCIAVVLFALFCKKEEEEEEIINPTPLNPVVIDTARDEVRISCVVKRMWIDDSVARHNCIVSKYGSNAGKAVLVSHAHHADFYDALIALGADPGVDIGENPDTLAAPTGTEFKVLISFEDDTTRYDINDLVEDSLGFGLKCRMHNSYTRAVSTNKGCIYCYTTCKTSITSNPAYVAKYTYVPALRPPFKPIRDKWPAEGTHAVVIFKKVE
ncbi:MAG: YdjY domain-containing protein [candidate division WOR-3 bacterium]|nr:YdjY domain-containing protein [candidate division WOR-3 bacterium]